MAETADLIVVGGGIIGCAVVQHCAQLLPPSTRIVLLDRGPIAGATSGSCMGHLMVTPDDAQAAKLLAAEEALKQQKSTAPVEQAMREIVEQWKAQGITDILFARADAPKAKHGIAGQVEGVRILSYFDILADAAADKIPAALKPNPARSPSA